MIPSKLLTASRIVFSASIVLLFILLQPSCKKADILSDKKESTNESKIEYKAGQFFELPANASSALQRVARELERQNKAKEFIKQFISKEGFPIWNKASIYINTKGIKNNPTAGFDAGALSDTTVLIPLVWNAEKYVHGFIWANIRDTIALKIFRQNDYVNFPFQTSQTPVSTTSAENFALRMMLMDKEVFGSTEFEVKDKRLFNYSTVYRDTATAKRFVKFDSSATSNFSSNGTTGDNIMQLVCVTITTQTTTVSGNHCPYPPNQCPNYYTGTPGPCDNCAAVCASVSTTYNTIYHCEIWNEEEGEGWPSMPGGGGTGGGGNPTGGGGQPPCGSFGSNIINGIVPINCEPGPGGNPWPVTTTHAEFNPLISNNDPDLQWWDDNSTDYPAQMLPSWSTMNSNFPKKADGTEMCGSDVYSLIGGQVLANMPPGSNPNACALRVSRALNYSGINIPVIPGHTYQGADGKNYFLSSAKLYNFMKKTFKIPPNATNSIETFSKSQGGADGKNFPSLLSGKKGIYLMEASYPAMFGALGHATLYDGTSCVHNTCDGIFHDGCYFKAKGGVEKIALFKLN